MRDPLAWVPIKIKLSASYVIICVLAFGVGGYLISTSARSAVEREIMERLQWQSAAGAQSLDHGLSLLARRTEDFASDGFIRSITESIVADGAGRVPAPGRSTTAAAVTELERHLSLNKLSLVPAYRNILIFDEEGKLRAAAHPGKSAPPASKLATIIARNDLAYTGLPQIASTDHQVSDPGSRIPRSNLQDPVHDDHLFAISTPLWNLARSRRLGTLVTVVDLERWLTTSLPAASMSSSRGAEEKIRLTLIDADGSGIEILPARGEDTLPVNRIRVTGLSAEEFRDLSLTRDEQDTGMGFIRGDHFSYSYMIPQTGWRLMIDRNATDALAPISTLQSQFLGAGLLIVIATIVLLFFPMRFLIQPISELGAVARRIAAGDFAARSRLESQDEIGELGNAFNVMAEAVEERTRRLELSAHDLEQKKNDLAIERDRLRAVVHAMKDGLVLLDEFGRVELSNEAAGPLMNILVGGGSVAARRCATMDREAAETDQQSAGSNRKSRNCAHCLADAFESTTTCMIDSNDRVFEVLATQLPSARGGGGRVLVARDVTEYVTLDERKVHQERLAVLGEVGAVIAHELNNPLAAISMYAQMMERELETDPRWNEHVDVIRRNTEICKRTVRGLLDYASASAENSTGPEPEKVDIHEMLHESARFLRPILEKAGVTVEWGLDSPETSITCVESHLRHVFVNLLLNACQAQIIPGGRIRIRTAGPREPNLAGGSVPATMIAVEIEDNGPGIPESLRGRIFDPFFTSKSSGQGTGLGLSTARRIIDAIGGSLTLVSGEPGRTLFRVMVPLVAARASWRDLARIVIPTGIEAEADTKAEEGRTS